MFRNLSILVIFAGIFVGLPLYANPFLEAHTAAQIDPSCALQVGDPFENASRISSVSYSHADACLDTNRFRHAVILKHEPLKSIKIANYLHQSKFWIAKIPLEENAIDQLYFQIVVFDLGGGIRAAHTQWRVRFKSDKAVELYEQATESTTPSLYTNDLILSTEAARPKDVPYNFALGVMDNYVLAGRVLSGDQYVFENPDRATEQYSLNLSKGNIADFLTKGLEKSSQDGFKLFYNTLNPNCTTVIFDLLDTIPEIQARKAESFKVVLSGDSIAGPSLNALKNRKILGSPAIDLRLEKNPLLGGLLPAAPLAQSAGGKSYFPQVPGYPFSLILSLPQEDSNDEFYQKQLTQKMVLKLYDHMPSVIASFATATLVDTSAPAERMALGLKRLLSELKHSLKEWSSTLPAGQTVDLSLYLAPWSPKRGEKFLDPADWGVQLKLPFEGFLLKSKSASDPILFQNFTSGFQALSKLKPGAKQPLQPYFLALHFHLDARDPRVNVQFLGELKSGSIAKKVQDPKLTIESVYIPFQSNFMEKSFMLLNAEQYLGWREPKITLEFGPYGGFDPREKRIGELKLFSPDQYCDLQKNSVPQLIGKVGPEALGSSGIKRWIGNFIQGKDISFGVFRADLNPGTGKLQSLDLRMDTFPVTCRSDANVNVEFSKAINEKIHLEKDNLTKDPNSLQAQLIRAVDAFLGL